MNPRVERAAWWARQTLLTVGAVVGVICAVASIGAMLFGLRPLVFQSGSMSPEINTGDLAISRSVGASSLEVGQVVSVSTGSGERVTHRIVSVDHDGAEAVLVLRGDANETADATPYQVSHADVVLFHVPRLGYVVGWLSSPFGLFLLGLYAAFLLSVLVRRPPETRPLSAESHVVSPSRPGRRRSAVQGGLAMVLIFGGIAGAAAAHQVTPTLAAWTDTVQITGSQFSVAAPSVQTPAGFTCTPATDKGDHTVTFTWLAVPGATYVLHRGAGGATQFSTSNTTVTTARNEAGTAWVTAVIGAATSAASTTITYKHEDCYV